MMLIDIHDVGHGACSVVTFPNGTRMMIDAGHNSEPFWAPSVHYYGERVDLLLLQNLDSDHLSDLPYVLDWIDVKAIRTNPTISHRVLAYMKREQGMNTALRAAYDVLRKHGPDTGPRPNLGDAWGTIFCNRYWVDFKDDTNNLSVAVFIGYGPFTILFGGDLERAGWLRLLRIPGFRALLSKVTVFVASHHGRESGCCDDVFLYCRPQIAVISDREHLYSTQETVDWYRAKVTGIPDLSRIPARDCPQPIRRVLTTRSDGSIQISVQPTGRYNVTTEFSGGIVNTLWRRRLGLMTA